MVFVELKDGKLEVFKVQIDTNKGLWIQKVESHLFFCRVWYLYNGLCVTDGGVAISGSWDQTEGRWRACFMALLYTDQLDWVDPIEQWHTKRMRESNFCQYPRGSSQVWRRRKVRLLWWTHKNNFCVCCLFDWKSSRRFRERKFLHLAVSSSQLGSHCWGRYTRKTEDSFGSRDRHFSWAHWSIRSFFQSAPKQETDSSLTDNSKIFSLREWKNKCSLSMFDVSYFLDAESWQIASWL